MKINHNKILIVDDERALRIGLARCVNAEGFEHIEASDGNEALKLASEHMPGLVILDVMMRGMSGLEVCRKVRQDKEMKEIKVIMLSARGQQKEREEGLEAGADYYITKPFDYRELIKHIKSLLETS